MKTRVTNAKIACLDMNLTKQRMHLGVHITIDDPEQLEAIRARSVYTFMSAQQADAGQRI